MYMLYHRCIDIGKMLGDGVKKLDEDELKVMNNLVSGYFHMVGMWMNMKDGWKEIPFVSRNYK